LHGGLSDVQRVLRAIEDRADEPEGSNRTVAYALARKLAWRRSEIKAEMVWDTTTDLE
jgi:hypothetical protein